MCISGQICQGFFVKLPQKSRKTWLHEGDGEFTLEAEGGMGFLLKVDPPLRKGAGSSGALADLQKPSPHLPCPQQQLSR